jgi:hypothetical protein
VSAIVGIRTPPQMSAKTQEFLQRNHGYRQKYGQAADRALVAAHNAAIKHHAVDSPGYFQFGKDWVEMNGHFFGAPYDPNTESADWKEIAHKNNPGKTNAEKEQNYIAHFNRGRAWGKIGTGQ